MIMKTSKSFKRFSIEIFTWIFVLTNIIPVWLVSYAESTDIVFPLKEISKLECRFEDFSKLSPNCKMKVLKLKSKDYTKYIKTNWWYNDYTRLYTVLWWSSYKYGWDVWYWWHIWTDIATAKWTPVYAIADWEIKIAKSMLWLWNTVSINHTIRWKFISSNYWHLSKILVRKWQKIKAWDKIWEVWSTGNSTWNHLHFQIDLDTTFHPYYYWRKECPYSYYDITEKWVCFDELQKNTIDPIVFFETDWKILDKIKITTTKVSIKKTINKPITKIKTVTNKNTFNYSIFDRTVYVWYHYNDIIEVQAILKDLWEYKWEITWNYNDLIKTIISYQISNNILNSKNDLWSWWFWPKTRKQVRHDYENFLNNWWKRWNYVIEKDIPNNNLSSNNKTITNNISIKKIDRKNILTREQIDKREVDDFLRNNTIDLKFEDLWWNIEIWKTKILKLLIKTKRGRGYRWNTPKWLTFSIDNSKIKVFPEKLYYFTDWKRDIKITWLKEGSTILKVKLGDKVIKIFKLNIYKAWKTVYPKSWQIFWVKSLILWDKKSWLILFKDNKNKKLVNFVYWWNFTLKTNSWVKICLKKWEISNIRRIFKSTCLEKDYKDTINFSYKDTVWWLLVFDYKAVSKDATIELINNYDKKTFSSRKILVKNPSWLAWDYAYEKEVLEMLEKWIVWWLKRWYFLENRELTKADWNKWIIKALEKVKNETFDNNIKQLAINNILKLKNEEVSQFEPFSRKEFLNKTYDYLVFNKTPPRISIKYRDLEKSDNKKINSILNKDSTWRDRFWDNYYRPEIKITRGEWAYFLSKVLEKNKSIYLSVR